MTHEAGKTGGTLDILSGPVWKKMLLFVLPIMGGNLFQQLYYYVDAAVVGHVVGSTALGAVDSTQALLSLLIDFFVGLSTGATIIISQLWGAGEKSKVGEAVHTALAFALIVGLVVLAAGELLAEPLLGLMQTPPENMGYALAFIRVQFVGVPFLMVYNMGASILRSVGDSKRPFYFLVAASAVNIVLVGLFVAVLGWGVAGSAWATVGSISLSAAFVMAVLVRSREAYRMVPRRIRLSGPMLRKVVGIGLPTGIQMSMFSISNIIIQTGVNACGAHVVSAFTVCNKCYMVLWLVLDAFALGATTFMGQCYGAGDVRRARQGARWALVLCYAFTMPLGALIVAFAPQIAGVFTSDVSLLPDMLTFLYLLVPGFYAFVLAQVLTGAIRGTGETVKPMVIMIVGVCLLRVVWLATVAQAWPGAVSVAAAYPVSWVFTGLVSVAYYLRGGWRARLARVEERAARREAAGE